VITADIVNSYAHLREHGAEIVIEAPLPPVMANPAALAQCLSNLLSNAVKFVPQGKPPAVRVSGERRGRFVRICVSDNGIGISQEGQTRLFGIFERLNNSAQFEGTGIGLAIVRRAVIRMNGRCGVKSRLGEGSQFWIELKAAE
jgi:signal transduction histidine kinase